MDHIGSGAQETNMSTYIVDLNEIWTKKQIKTSIFSRIWMKKGKLMMYMESTRGERETLVDFNHTNHTGFEIVIGDQIGLELVVRGDFGTSILLEILMKFSYIITWMKFKNVLNELFTDSK